MIVDERVRKIVDVELSDTDSLTPVGMTEAVVVEGTSFDSKLVVVVICPT